MADTPTSSEISAAAEILRAGGLVAFPTETVYGLGANALDVRAVARVFEVKGRPHFDPLIVHVASWERAESLVDEFPPIARQLADRFWPGPLTLVLPKREIIPDLVTSGGPTVAVRVPDHPLALALLRAADVPVAAPSANLFGRISPTTAEHVREQLGDRIDLILDGGPCRVGVESTVLQITLDEPPRLLRPGGVTLEEIEALVGRVSYAHQSALHETSQLSDDMNGGHSPPYNSPGMLPQHYAPRTPLVLQKPGFFETPGFSDTTRTGLITLLPPGDPSQFARVEALSPSGDLREAAANFFAALRRLDAADLDLIVAIPFPEHDLGIALNDRLARAAAK